MRPDAFTKGLHVYSGCAGEGDHEGYDGDGSWCSAPDKVDYILYGFRTATDGGLEDCSYDTISPSKPGTRFRREPAMG